MQQLIGSVFNVFYWLLLFRVIASFIALDFRRPPWSYVFALTEPVLAPVRRAFGLIRIGNAYIDVSPLIVLVMADILRRLLALM